MKRFVVPALLAIAALTSSCSGDDSGAAADDYIAADPNDTPDMTKFAFTSTIKITSAGFVPLQAVAVFGETVSFVNETTESQTISFINGGLGAGGAIVEVGPIAPGASASVPEPLSAAISLVFESDGLPGKQGHLQVDPGVDEL